MARETPTAGPLVTIECPCCGDDAWVGKDGDEILDGTPLICGCKGHIMTGADDEEPYAWVNEECWCGRE